MALNNISDFRSNKLFPKPFSDIPCGTFERDV